MPGFHGIPSLSSRMNGAFRIEQSSTPTEAEGVSLQEAEKPELLAVPQASQLQSQCQQH